MAGNDDELPERRKRAPARRFDGTRLDERAVGELKGWLARLDEIDVHFTRIAGMEDFVRIDPAALEPLAEAIGMACEDLLDEGPPAGASRTLAWNLTLAARAYGDAIDVVLGTTDENDQPFNPASDYLWSGVSGETDLALVIGVAREARDCAAREAGLPSRRDAATPE
jgi:hypothetical protein